MSKAEKLGEVVSAQAALIADLRERVRALEARLHDMEKVVLSLIHQESGPASSTTTTQARSTKRKENT